MCLALPGKVEALNPAQAGAVALPFGRVRFGSVVKDVCLAFTPDVQVGEFVIVHVGFALQRLDQAAAEQTLREVGLTEVGLLTAHPTEPTP